MRVRRLPLDLAPWTLFRALARKDQPFFIDAGQPWGNEWVSSMGFGPRMQLQVRAGDPSAATALAALERTLAEAHVPATARAHPRPVPFAGGTVVGLAYELKNAIERLPQTQTEARNAARVVCASYDAVVSYDHRCGTYRVASWQLDDAALARYAEEVLDAVADATRAAATPDRTYTVREGSIPLTSTLDAEAYAARAERIRAYIAAGDVYQVNLSLGLHTTLPCPALELYGNVRAVQPVPFGGYFDFGIEQVLSNSPELFLRRRGEQIATCPIKGTRRRGATGREDARLATELRADPKEFAEHVMIVDLERNDLGRVCRTGSVVVSRFAEVLRLATVQHLVSTVTGIVPHEVTTGDVLRATFPGGSITGAPKIRAMEIIDELERGPRGFYTGALGWIDASGDLDLNVAIRTAVARDGMLSYHAGSAIVADSRPELEYAESLLKAQAFLRALGLAVHPPAAPRYAAFHGSAPA